MCNLINLPNLLILLIFINSIASFPAESKQNAAANHTKVTSYPYAVKGNTLNEMNTYYGRPNDYYGRNRNDATNSFEMIERKINRRNKKRELDKHGSKQQPAAIFDLILGILDTFRLDKNKYKLMFAYCEARDLTFDLDNMMDKVKDTLDNAADSVKKTSKSIVDTIEDSIKSI